MYEYRFVLVLSQVKDILEGDRVKYFYIRGTFNCKERKVHVRGPTIHLKTSQRHTLRSVITVGFNDREERQETFVSRLKFIPCRVNLYVL